MAVKPVKFISDILAKKQILKTDSNENVLFSVSGTLPNGSVSSSLPITASGLFIDGNAEIVGTLNARRMHITEITTSVYYEDSLSASINALQDVSASNAQVGSILQWDGINWVATTGANLSGSFTGSLNGTAAYAITAAYSLATTPLSINDLTDVSASSVVSGNILRWDGSYWIPDNSLSGLFSGSFSGNLDGTASYAVSSSYAITAAYALAASGAVLSINDLTDVSASNALASQFLKYDGAKWVASEVSGIGVSRQQYINLRYNSSGTFTSDTVELQLPPTFTSSSIKYLSFNLLTRETIGSNWRNDLASVEFKLSASAVWAVLSAPTQPYEYTFNVVNDNPDEVQQAVITNEYTDLYISGTLTLSGSPMPALNVTGTTYNVDTVFHTINNKFTVLEALSEQQKGNFDINGFADVQLTNYVYADLDYVAVDVMVKSGSSPIWKNDLISVELSGNMLADKLHVLISAPALTNSDFYRIIANKQTGSL